jgi:hypothetical protein
LFLITKHASLCFALHAQEEINDPNHIKTVIFKPATVNSYAPIIPLGGMMKLSFDDLNADEADYRYKIEHCELDWTKSVLSETEFIDGYAEDRIRDYENSFNTLQPFTHYRLTIPNDQTRIKLSGNYRIQVLNDDDDIVFSRKFIIYESKTTVGVAIYRSRNIKNIKTQQAVEFTINHPNFRINNPSVEIIPMVLQNNNLKTAILGLKPQFYRGSQLLYKYNTETSFYAGNEFLHFDSKSIRNTTLNIGRVTLEDIYHSHLYTNYERRYLPYTLNPDINGNFVIRVLHSDEPDTEADYSWVHFSLDYDDLGEKELFISGKFNNWQLNDMNRMQYNELTGLYEKSLLLKQGFYNYQYLTRSSNGELSNYDVDGSFYQTENDYTVVVYYKRIGERYIRVIGVGYGNSKKINN